MLCCVNHAFLLQTHIERSFKDITLRNIGTQRTLVCLCAPCAMPTSCCLQPPPSSQMNHTNKDHPELFPLSSYPR